MKRLPRWSWVLLGLAVLALVATGVVMTSSEAEAKGPCRCPMIYAPVTCDHGKTFANQCLADCRNAQNCVPSGAL